MSNAAFFSAIAPSDKIDADKGVIFGVSVITIGEAAGKNCGTWIDKTTLSQIHSVATGFKNGVKVKLSMAKEHDGSIGQVVGVLKNFRTEGEHERADFHLLKSDENFSKIIEMSSTMPTEFGFSVVVPKKMEKVGGKECLRCEDIYSIDLVESPAANPSGLFSKDNETNIMSEKAIKYAKGDSGDHDKTCECKECMSKKSMSTETIDIAALTAKITESLKPVVEAQIATLTAKITEHETKLATYEQGNAAAALSAKKAEIAGLVADATREGKVVPLTDEQLLAMPVDVIKSMFSKLTKGQVKLSGTRQVTAPKDASGNVIEFKNNDEKIAFARAKHEEGAQMLQERLSAIFEQDHPTFSATRN